MTARTSPPTPTATRLPGSSITVDTWMTVHPSTVAWPIAHHLSIDLPTCGSRTRPALHATQPAPARIAAMMRTTTPVPCGMPPRSIGKNMGPQA